MGPTGNTGATGPTGPTGAKGDKGNKGDKGEVGDINAATKKQLIMVNEDFATVTYPNTFKSFEFEGKPYNGGRGANLVVTKSITKELVPFLGLRTPIKITQDANPDHNSNKTTISIIGQYTEQREYGVIFAIQDHNNGATKTVGVSTWSDTGIFLGGDIRRLGTLDRNGNTYEYYLARIEKNTTGETQVQFDVEFSYTSTNLPGRKMSISVYGGSYFYSYPVRITEPQISQTNFTFHITKTMRSKNSKILWKETFFSLDSSNKMELSFLMTN